MAYQIIFELEPLVSLPDMFFYLSFPSSASSPSLSLRHHPHNSSNIKRSTYRVFWSSSRPLLFLVTPSRPSGRLRYHHQLLYRLGEVSLLLVHQIFTRSYAITSRLCILLLYDYFTLLVLVRFGYDSSKTLRLSCILIPYLDWHLPMRTRAQSRLALSCIPTLYLDWHLLMRTRARSRVDGNWQHLSCLDDQWGYADALLKVSIPY